MPQFSLPSKRDLILLEKIYQKFTKMKKGIFLLKSSPFEFEDIYKIKNLQVLGSSSETPFYQI